MWMCYLQIVIYILFYLVKTKKKISKITAIKWGGRPTRLLPPAKMLIIPIELFLSAG